MAALHETTETLRERARRALQANPDNAPPRPFEPLAPAPVHPVEPSPLLTQAPPAPAHAPHPQAYPYSGEDLVEQVDLRLRAIRLMRDLEAKQACYREQVRALSLKLSQTPGDSIHYRPLLDKLGEAHEVAVELDAHLESAQFIIHSTEWIVSLLTYSSGSAGRGRP